MVLIVGVTVLWEMKIPLKPNKSLISMHSSHKILDRRGIFWSHAGKWELGVSLPSACMLLNDLGLALSA